jgi:hypothetical protein
MIKITSPYFILLVNCDLLGYDPEVGHDVFKIIGGTYYLQIHGRILK